MKTGLYKTAMLAFALMIIFIGRAISEDSFREIKIKTSAYSFMCKNRIETEVKKLDGVRNSVLSLENKVLTVKFNPSKVTTDKIKTTISDMGYTITVESEKDLGKDETNKKEDNIE
ncbi:MAG: heavy metal-associated domain-containing protein [Candidatus Kapabacteria bacterium]|nr:heavy metal-associated domain-containing protein [Candidatus Kapabacteria bacterium]